MDLFLLIYSFFLINRIINIINLFFNNKYLQIKSNFFEFYLIFLFWEAINR